SRSLEVLQNWLDKPARVRCPLRISETKLAGRKVFVYAGNMGVAQGMEILLDLAERLQERSEVGFLFVGRGSDAARLKMGAQRRSLGNVLFFDELHPDEIPDLYAQCSVGIVTLDPRHKSHNIPGKFLTYLQSGLPVLANVNPGNDLAAIIRREGVGKVCETNDVEDMVLMVEALLGELDAGTDFSARCKELFEREFSAERAVKQIVAGLSA
ncbi:MAG TPA: glycosyltransferase family 4 protein, partial [Nitrospira sp.]|nr:glycosyltransferase family 4 protein [Nitrospira sp.]